MNKPITLPVAEGRETGGLEIPQVFVRAFTVPAAMPWDQTKAALLETRHGAPLPITEVMYRARRLGAWSIGRPGRFAAFYIRSREYRSPFETIVDVEGQPMKIGFGSKNKKQLQTATKGLPVLLLIAFTAFLLTAAPMVAITTRMQLGHRLDLAEQQMTAKARLAEKVRRQRDYMRALRVASAESRPVTDVLRDFSWATAARNPEASLVAVHWDHGLLAIETRGKTAPFIGDERTLQRSEKPLREDVWLWAVRPEADAGAAPPSNPISEIGG